MTTPAPANHPLSAPTFPTAELLQNKLSWLKDNAADRAHHLVQQAHQAANQWQLTFHQPLDGGTMSLVWLVGLPNGTTAVLKIPALEGHAQQEARWLAHGHGPTLLQADDRMLLMEHLQQHQPASQLTAETQLEVLVATWQQLHTTNPTTRTTADIPPEGIPTARQRLSRWLLDAAHKLSTHRAATASRHLTEALTKPDSWQLCHGDLLAKNILINPQQHNKPVPLDPMPMWGPAELDLASGIAETHVRDTLDLQNTTHHLQQLADDTKQNTSHPIDMRRLWHLTIMYAARHRSFGGNSQERHDRADQLHHHALQQVGSL